MGEKRKKIDWKELPEGQEKRKYYMKSDEWKEVRQKVLDYYGHHCMFCGRTDEEVTLTVHHIKYDGVLYNELENLQWVIPVCSCDHLCLHRNKNNIQRFKKK